MKRCLWFDKQFFYHRHLVCFSCPSVSIWEGGGVISIRTCPRDVKQCRSRIWCDNGRMFQLAGASYITNNTASKWIMISIPQYKVCNTNGYFIISLVMHQKRLCCVFWTGCFGSEMWIILTNDVSPVPTVSVFRLMCLSNKSSQSKPLPSPGSQCMHVSIK